MRVEVSVMRVEELMMKVEVLVITVEAVMMAAEAVTGAAANRGIESSGGGSGDNQCSLRRKLR